MEREDENWCDILKCPNGLMQYDSVGTGYDVYRLLSKS